ncbi:GATA type zinc finger protein asd-4 [Ceratocystis platani]|uniref:GATA type zinc finger protein asd-4 n=1 Tax=Ceratocystis fimbriata f. sp. platani TaxID=88771 RepID=A0A0F8B0B7_CERFI|nr:GATA type zinc finger protein asd-4 [Ceratocystis platani]
MEDNSQILSLPNSTATIEVPAQNGEPASQADAVPTSAAATTTTNATTAPAVNDDASFPADVHGRVAGSNYWWRRKYLAPDMNSVDLGSMAQAARRAVKPGNGMHPDADQNARVTTQLYNTAGLSGFSSLEDAHFSQAALGQFPTRSGSPGLHGDGRHDSASQTHDQLIASLRTRVNELELINELFRGRLGQLEHDEANARRGQELSGVTENQLRQEIDDLLKANSDIRMQLEESHRRENALKRRLDELDVELREALDGNVEPGRKRARITEALESTNMALATISDTSASDTHIHGLSQPEHDINGQVQSTEDTAALATRAALVASMVMGVEGLSHGTTTTVDNGVPSVQMTEGLQGTHNEQQHEQSHEHHLPTSISASMPEPMDVTPIVHGHLSTDIPGKSNLMTAVASEGVSNEASASVNAIEETMSIPIDSSMKIDPLIQESHAIALRAVTDAAAAVSDVGPAPATTATTAAPEPAMAVDGNVSAPTPASASAPNSTPVVEESSTAIAQGLETAEQTSVETQQQ